MGWKTSLGKVADRLTKPDEQLDSDDLRESTRKLGATPICDAVDRSITCCCMDRLVLARPRWRRSSRVNWASASAPRPGR